MCFQARVCCTNKGFSSTGAPGVEEVPFAPAKLMLTEMQRGAQPRWSSRAHPLLKSHNLLRGQKKREGTEYTALFPAARMRISFGGPLTPSGQEVGDPWADTPVRSILSSSDQTPTE